MVALGGDGFGGRERQGSILLERFMIRFHMPSFAIASGDAVVSEFEVAGDQIEDTDAAIFVCEDLLDQLEREIYALQIDCHGRSRFQSQFIDTHILTLLMPLKAQGDLAISLQGHDEIALEGVLDELHIICRGIPDIIDHIVEGYLVGDHLPQQLLIDLIFRHRCPPLLLTCFGVKEGFRLRDQMVVHRQRHPLYMVQRRDEVDALDRLPTGVVVVPTHNLVFVCMRFFRDAVVDDHNPLLRLNLSHIRFDHLPEVGSAFDRAGQKPLDAVMTDRTIQQPRHPCPGRQPKRTDEIVGVDVEQFFIVHAHSLPHLVSAVRNISDNVNIRGRFIDSLPNEKPVFRIETMSIFRSGYEVLLNQKLTLSDYFNDLNNVHTCIQ
jgi:hypothetical protein